MVKTCACDVVRRRCCLMVKLWVEFCCAKAATAKCIWRVLALVICMPEDEVPYSCGCDDVDGGDEDVEDGDDVDDGDDGGDGGARGDGGDETGYTPANSVQDGVSEAVDGGVVGDCSEHTTIGDSGVGTILVIV